MSNKSFYLFYSIFTFLFMLILSCDKDIEIDNPYDKTETENNNNNGSILNDTNFAGLYYNIFQPNCANSGCHDGTFEPDFRSIESSYNTMVYQSAIKNDSLGTYTYRVQPGNHQMSVLYQRLVIDIDGKSGIMPLVTNTNTDWKEKKDDYIDDIISWINNGAKDIFGKEATKGNKEPQVSGFIGYADGNASVLSRTKENETIEVPASANTVKFFFSLSDDSTGISQLSSNKVNFSYSIYDFTDSTQQALSYNTSAVSAIDFFGDTSDFYHAIEVAVQDFELDSTVYVRVYTQDADHNTPTEIPDDGSFIYIYKYFSFVIK